MEGLDQECEMRELVHLFVFGDKYDMPKLRNNVIDRIIRQFEGEKTVVGGLRYIYDKTPPESPLRKVIVATYLYSSKSPFYETHKDSLLACPEFLFDLAKAYHGKQKKPEKNRIFKPC